MSKTATLRTRLEPSLKSEVEDIRAQLGWTASETVHLLYRQIKRQRTPMPPPPASEQRCWFGESFGG